MALHLFSNWLLNCSTICVSCTSKASLTSNAWRNLSLASCKAFNRCSLRSGVGRNSLHFNFIIFSRSAFDPMPWSIENTRASIPALPRTSGTAPPIFLHRFFGGFALKVDSCCGTSASLKVLQVHFSCMYGVKHTGNKLLGLTAIMCTSGLQNR